MSRIPQSFIDDLLSRLDIVNIIDSRVKLKRTGKNYAACCPFHQEKTPSFTVSPDKQFYYCFGCGASGNALGFIMEYEREGFIDAVEFLAKTAGVEVPREKNPEFRQHDLKRKKLFKILEQAAELFQQQLKDHPQKHAAVRYLQNRGLSGAIARDFGLGFAPPGRDLLLKALGKDEESIALLIDAGLVIHKEEEKVSYDRFRHRIMFPIRDDRGRIIGFGGRVLGDDKPKYLNSPETQVFQKGRELYGLYEAKQERKLDSLIVVEGYMDVIALAQYGIKNAVATLGTACGEEHLKLAFRYVSNVVFCFDGDKAGRNAAKRGLLNALSAMEDGRQIKFLFLPEGQDPDTLVRQIGAERFIAQTKTAVSLEEFLFNTAAEGIDIGNMDGRARFSKTAAPLLAQLPDGIFKELMFDNLARRTGLTREVLDELQKEKLELSEPEEQSEAPPSKRIDLTPPLLAELTAPPAHTGTQPNARQRVSSLKLNPAKVATILLLENPSLLTQHPQLPELPDFAEDSDPDNRRLGEIMAYLKRRPESNFNNILGFWGGTKGVEAQQELAALVANQLLSSVKTIPTYNPLQEFIGAIDCLCKNNEKVHRLSELNRLKARGLANLSLEEKARFVELTRS